MKKDLKQRGKTMLQKQLKVETREKRINKIPEDQIDRIQAHILEGRKLWKKDAEFFERARQIYPLICAGKSMKYIIKFVDKSGWGSDQVAYRLVRKTKKLYEFNDDIQGRGNRSIYIEMAKRCFRAAEKSGDARSMVAAVKLMAEIDGALTVGDSYTQIFNSLQMPQIIFTDNPEVLSNNKDVEAIEYNEFE